MILFRIIEDRVSFMFESRLLYYVCAVACPVIFNVIHLWFLSHPAEEKTNCSQGSL